MEIVLVHPTAALVALVGMLPLGVFWLLRRRRERVRHALRLPPPRRRSDVAVAAAIVAAAVLVGAAAAQPVLLRSYPLLERRDAEVYVVMDVTRSMLAGAGPEAPTRLERGRDIARRLRAAVPDLPVGIATFTNRIVPHVFPTTNAAVFESGLRQSIDIESPPPDRQRGAVQTALDALTPLQTHAFYAPKTQRRVAVVLTDGETRPYGPDTVAALRAAPRLDLLFVRIWAAGERIHRSRAADDRTYVADAAATARLDTFARDARAPVFAEADAGDAADALRQMVGEGEAVVVGREARSRPLAPWTLALALAPVAYLIRRRSF